MVRVDAEGTRHTLAIAQAFIRNQGDAWTWMLDWMMRVLADIAGSGGEGGAAEAPAGHPERFADCEAIASAIGQRLGEMHAVLARPTDNPDFAPERASAETTAEWANAVRVQIEAAMRALAAQHELEQRSAEEAAALAGARGRLLDAVHALAAGGAGTALTRIHGDLHLGQMLVSSGDVYIIDFEGEPARPLAERRAKTSPMRDVAGVIRSFDYAAAVMRRKSREAHPHLSEETREAFLSEYLSRVNASFVAGYRVQMAPLNDMAEAALLQLFLIEKAAYEIAYEAANRPSWINVPLHGLARIADQVLSLERQAAE